MSTSSIPPAPIPLSPPSPIPSSLILVRLIITAGANKAAFFWDRKMDSSRQGYIPRPLAIFVVITRNWILKYVNTHERIRDTFSFRHVPVAYMNCLFFAAGVAIRFPNNLILPLELSPILVDDKKTGGYACFDNVRNYLGAFLFRKLMLKIIQTKYSTKCF
jgi:hypothetical protein